MLKEKSAIATKADHIRVIGRETIRLYCGGAQTVEGLSKNGETNSIGGRLSRPRIDLIAGRESNLQPAVLGNNLLEYLNTIEDQIKNFHDNISTISEHLMAINSLLAVLTAGAPPFSANFAGDITVWTEQLFGTINSELRKINHLNSLEFIKGRKSVVSNSVFIT